MSRHSRVRDTAEALLVSFAAAGLGRLSPRRAEAGGRRLGSLLGRTAAPRRGLVRRNLALAFPERTPAEIGALARDVYAHFGGLAAEILATLDEPLDELLARVEVENLETARAAFAGKRGLFFLTPHLGSWELAALATAALGMPATVIARPLDNSRLEKRLRAFRERAGNTVVPKAEAAREILRAIRSGGAVGILLDQHARGADAVNVPFFGRPAATSSALARFVDRTEALVVPATAIRIGPARYRLRFEEPIDVRTLSREERTPERLTALLSSRMESQIRRAPEQWLWLHNRWK
ncbi:MAG TPA: lysophospholipid acyltransferase family protein [Thermoanaerobaculia bacterium]|nr:lysophospholipid acyltransferase family protein [Thermoanaerobaculia bacterium]